MRKKLTREEARRNLEKGLQMMKRTNSWEDARYLLGVLYAETCLHLSGVPFPPGHHDDMERVLRVYGEKYEALESFERTKRVVAILSSRPPEELHDPCPPPRPFLRRVLDRLWRPPGLPSTAKPSTVKDICWKIQGVPFNLRWLQEKEDEWLERGLIR